MEKEEFIQRFAQKLSAQQLAGVTAEENAVLLLAVPGSGKTTVLVTRLGYLLLVRGIHPEICVEGHWVPVNPEDTLADLLPGDGASL